MTYLPDMTLAKQTLNVGSHGTLVLFEVYDLKFCDHNDPYKSVLQELAHEGLHRNVFLVDSHSRPKWRVADYMPQMPDHFVEVRTAQEDIDRIVGITFQGFIYSIELADGQLHQVGWQK